jgi:hypothetical protein
MLKRDYDFEIGIRGPDQAKTCFPFGMNVSGWIEVTRVGDLWARFLNPQTGEEFDCAEYAKRMQSIVDDASF